MPGFRGEYLCVLQRDVNGREDLLVRVECEHASSQALVEQYRERLKRRLGVDVQVELCPLASLAALTGVEVRQKPVRLIKQS
jgi:phenylacetate-CoA ligase